MRLSLKGKKITINHILLYKLWHIGQIYTIPRYIKKEIERIDNCLWNNNKKKTQQPHKDLAQLFIWRGRLDILEIGTHWKSLKIKWIQRLLNPTNALRRDLILYRLNLILNSSQSLALFRQKQIMKICKNRTKKNSLFCYLVLDYISPVTTSILPRL